MILVPISIVSVIAAAPTEGVYITQCGSIDETTYVYGLTAASIYRPVGAILVETDRSYYVLDISTARQFISRMLIRFSTGFT